MPDKTYLWLDFFQIYLFYDTLDLLCHFPCHSLYVLPHIFVVRLQHKSLDFFVRKFDHMNQECQINRQPLKPMRKDQILLFLSLFFMDCRNKLTTYDFLLKTVDVSKHQRVLDEVSLMRIFLGHFRWKEIVLENVLGVVAGWGY
jgi:hypothetical protein